MVRTIMFGSMDRPVPTDVFPERGDVCLEFCDHSSINDISVNLVAEETIEICISAAIRV